MTVFQCEDRETDFGDSSCLTQIGVRQMDGNVTVEFAELLPHSDAKPSQL